MNQYDPYGHWHAQRRYAVRQHDMQPKASRGDDWAFWGCVVLCGLAIIWRWL